MGRWRIRGGEDISRRGEIYPVARLTTGGQRGKENRKERFMPISGERVSRRGGKNQAKKYARLCKKKGQRGGRWFCRKRGEVKTSGLWKGCGIGGETGKTVHFEADNHKSKRTLLLSDRRNSGKRGSEISYERTERLGEREIHYNSFLLEFLTSRRGNMKKTRRL